MSRTAWEMSLGFTLAAGASGVVEGAKMCGVSKQAFSKCLNHFNEQMKLCRLPLQRGDESRQNMARARKLQVCPSRSEAFIEK
jgi:hypothetical protein